MAPGKCTTSGRAITARKSSSCVSATLPYQCNVALRIFALTAHNLYFRTLRSTVAFYGCCQSLAISERDFSVLGFHCVGLKFMSGCISLTNWVRILGMTRLPTLLGLWCVGHLVPSTKGDYLRINPHVQFPGDTIKLNGASIWKLPIVDGQPLHLSSTPSSLRHLLIAPLRAKLLNHTTTRY